MPEDILEDSLACGDGSGGKGQSLARATGLDKSGKSRITRAAESAATRSLRASIGRAAAAGRRARFRRHLGVRRMRREWPNGRVTACHARRTRLENPTVRARRRSGDFPLTSLANRQWRARAPCDVRRSVRDTGRVSWQCTHRSHGVDGHHSGHVVDGLCAFMKQLARAGALKSQSGRSKRGALVGREFIPGVLIRRGPSRSIRSTASVIAHTLTFRGPRSRRLSCGFLRHYSDGSVKPHQKVGTRRPPTWPWSRPRSVVGGASRRLHRASPRNRPRSPSSPPRTPSETCCDWSPSAYGVWKALCPALVQTPSSRGTASRRCPSRCGGGRST